MRTIEVMETIFDDPNAATSVWGGVGADPIDGLVIDTDSKSMTDRTHGGSVSVMESPVIHRLS